MLTRLLYSCGLYLGPKDELMPAQADNPDGFWEHLGFVALNDELLNELGGAWDLPPKHDENFTHAGLDPLRMKARLLIERFNCRGSRAGCAGDTPTSTETRLEDILSIGGHEIFPAATAAARTEIHHSRTMVLGWGGGGRR